MQKYSGNILFSISAYIMHWVNSILTYCEQSETKEGVLFPRILFVATHKDRVVRYSFKHGGGEIFLNQIKIRSLTCFPLLICFHVGISEETSSRVICE
jgi:hypothetical protein